jgi:hypothetical protein
MEQVERIEAGEADTASHCQEADDRAERLRRSKSYLLPISIFCAMVGPVGHVVLQDGPGRFGVVARIVFFLGLQVPLLTFALVDQLRQSRKWPVWKSVSVPVLGALIAAAVTLVLT